MNKEQNTNDYVSLFDYLGKPAGKEVGANVNRVATMMGIAPVKREVSNNRYRGLVNLYTREFLDVYFKFLQNYLA
jgi:hypothetical protein